MKKLYLTLTILVSLVVTSVVFTACNNEENEFIEKSFEKRPMKNTKLIVSINDVDVFVSLRPDMTVALFQNTKTGAFFVPTNREIFGWLFSFDDEGLAMATDYLKNVKCGAVYEAVDIETGERYYAAMYTNDDGDCGWINQLDKITLS